MNVMALPSVPELLREILRVSEEIEVPVYVGPAPPEVIRSVGAISIAESGVSRVELYLDLIRAQYTIRCQGPSLDKVEKIARSVFQALHQQGRKIVLEPSSGNKYLVHFTFITGGPVTGTGEIVDTWQEILTVETLIGTQPV